MFLYDLPNSSACRYDFIFFCKKATGNRPNGRECLMDRNTLQDIVGMRCTLFTRDNRFLFLGHIRHYDEKNHLLQVDSTQIIWGDIGPEMHIKLQLKTDHESQALLVIEGKTTKVEKDRFFLQPTNLIVKAEDRDYFRQRVMCPGVIAAVNNQRVKTPCIIHDLSATGIGLRSAKHYRVGDILAFQQQRFRPDGPTHDISFQVARVQEQEDGSFFYGCRFVNLPGYEEDILFQDIFALQAAEVNARRNR